MHLFVWSRAGASGGRRIRQAAVPGDALARTRTGSSETTADSIATLAEGHGTGGLFLSTRKTSSGLGEYFIAFIFIFLVIIYILFYYIFFIRFLEQLARLQLY